MTDNRESRKITTLDARPGDRFTFIAEETGNRFSGLILALEQSLVQVQWDSDGHKSWTYLETIKGTVEIHRYGKPNDTGMAVAPPGTDHQEPPEQVWQ